MQSERKLSSPTRKQLAAWRTFFETSLALLDICDAEIEAECGFNIRWYDVLAHLEGIEGGMQMNELAGSILSSKSGLTRVVDRMDEAGLVRRERPPEDRRVVKVLITDAGYEQLHLAREVHHRSIQEHFVEHLSDAELEALASALERVREHVRPLRPGRISAPRGSRSPSAKRS